MATKKTRQAAFDELAAALWLAHARYVGRASGIYTVVDDYDSAALLDCATRALDDPKLVEPADIILDALDRAEIGAPFTPYQS